MTMEITPERLEEIRKLTQSWLEKDSASLKQIQSLLGKLNFVAACVKSSRIFTGPAGSVVEHPLRDREVVGSNLGRAIPKALKMVPVATLLGAQLYKASTGFSSPNKISHN